MNDRDQFGPLALVALVAVLVMLSLGIATFIMLVADSLIP